VPAKVVLGIDQSNGADGIVATREIQTLRDLVGKRVAVQPGFVNHFFLLYLLDKEGIRPDSIEIQPMEPDAAGQAFTAGHIDVAVTWEPWLTTAIKREGAHVLISSADSRVRGVIVDILIVHNDVLKSRRETVKKVVDVWFKAVRYVRDNPAEAREIIASAFALSPPEVGQMLEKVIFLDERANAHYFAAQARSGTIMEVMQKAADLYYAQKLISARPPISDLIDRSFVEK